MQGGDGVGFFEELCAADDNMVPLDGWESFFAQFIEAKGPEVWAVCWRLTLSYAWWLPWLTTF